MSSDLYNKGHDGAMTRHHKKGNTMSNFLDQQDKAERKQLSEPTLVYTKRHGQKIKATFYFTSRQITKIITHDEVNQLKADDKFTVIERMS
jgi:hypothetical protein